jgi:hypothetical protein
MPLPSGKLLDEEVNAILIASGNSKRHRKRKLSSLMPNYETKIRKTAESLLGEWRENGVSQLQWEVLMVECPSLLSSYNISIRVNNNEACASPLIETENTEDVFQLELISDDELMDFDMPAIAILETIMKS